jgi:hypothetical protein
MYNTTFNQKYLMTFESFDPLKYKSTAETEVAAMALKREIKEILNSYVGWYDPFAELIQNSLDSLEERMALQETAYVPKLNIVINIQAQSLTVTDNGMA